MIYGKFSMIDLIIYLGKIKTLEDIKNNNMISFISELNKNKFTKKDRKQENDLAVKLLEKKLVEIQEKEAE